MVIKITRKRVLIICAVIAAIVLASAAAYAIGSDHGEQSAESASIASTEAVDTLDTEDAEYVEVTEETTATETTSTTSSSDIGLSKAKKIALAKVSGATSSDIVKAAKDYDDGILEYDIEIHYNGYEYEYEIDASSGSIISYDVEKIDIF